MIEISVHPTQISLDRLTEVTLRFAYRGVEFCTEVYFEIITPEGFFLMGGSPKGTVPLLEEGDYYDHPLRFLAEKSGAFDFIVTRLAFRDEIGRMQRLPDYPVSVNVFRPSVLALDLSITEVKLQADKWYGLPVIIRNTGKGIANQITLRLVGNSFSANETAGIVVQQLRPGEGQQVTFTVYFNKPGSRVPVDTTATCQDESGGTHSFSWHHYLVVEEKAPTSNVINQTNFHSKVTGPVHTGSGSINIGSEYKDD